MLFRMYRKILSTFNTCGPTMICRGGDNKALNQPWCQCCWLWILVQMWLVSQQFISRHRFSGWERQVVGDPSLPLDRTHSFSRRVIETRPLTATRRGFGADGRQRSRLRYCSPPRAYSTNKSSIYQWQPANDGHEHHPASVPTNEQNPRSPVAVEKTPQNLTARVYEWEV